MPPDALSVDEFDRNDPKVLESLVRKEIMRQRADGSLPRDLMKGMNLDGVELKALNFNQPVPEDDYENEADERMPNI